MKKYGNSSYWLDDFDNDDVITKNLSKEDKKSDKLYKLASSKRAISNFVSIVTNDNIPVKFNERGGSYTDGKTVVVGAEIAEPKDFDVAVGLALHEGSHIKLTDFDHLKNINSLVPDVVYDNASDLGIYDPVPVIKDIWNVVEDRRIDRFIFDSATGYRDYYRAMYDKYFNDKLVDKALLSDEHTDETVESYMFRIINIHNDNTRVDALKGLKRIYKTIGLGSINRLETSLDTFNVAVEVFKIMLENVVANSNDNQQDGDSQSGDANSKDGSDSKDGGDGNGSGNTSDEKDGDSDDNTMSDEDFDKLMDSLDDPDNFEDDNDSDDSNNSNYSGSADDSDRSNDDTSSNANGSSDSKGKISSSPSSNDGKGSEVKLSDKQKELLAKKIRKQKKFLNGKVNKKTVTKGEAKNLDAISESGSDMVNVAENTIDRYGKIQKGIECIVAKKLTQSLLESEMFPMSDKNHWYNSTESVRRGCEDEVKEGIRIGTILGRKLQIRGEARNTVYNRQRNGKVDKRMIASLGFGNENVFEYVETDSFKDANLHVSIDASSSMMGDKWSKTITNVTALCKAVDMISNLSIQVSFRTTSNDLPYIVMAYDSKVDKFSKVKKMFPCLTATGITPEGLCFEAIMKNFLSATNDRDSYFMNISDGEPNFGNSKFEYGGSIAVEHTRKMVKQIEGLGIQTLSYFVEEWGYGKEPSSDFKRMYGKGATRIDVTNVQQIIKTMNKLFLSK